MCHLELLEGKLASTALQCCQRQELAIIFGEDRRIVPRLSWRNMFLLEQKDTRTWAVIIIFVLCSTS